jgi:hypothetical protein
MAIVAKPRVEYRERNGLSTAFALYLCGCGCQIHYPDEGPRSCPVHGAERMGWTIYPKGHPQGPW